MQYLLPSFETILEIHQIVIETFGGLHGLPHPEYVQAAILRPQSYMQYDNDCDVYLVAAIILDSLARNHGFADGNKRTALIATLMTYNLNSLNKMEYSLHMNNQFEELVLWVAKDKPVIKAIRERLKNLVELFQVNNISWPK